MLCEKSYWYCLPLIKTLITITGNGPAKRAHHVRLGNWRESWTISGLQTIMPVRCWKYSCSPAHEWFQLQQCCFDNQNPRAHVWELSDGFKGALPTNLNTSLLEGLHGLADMKRSLASQGGLQASVQICKSIRNCKHGSSIKQSTLYWTESQSTWAGRQKRCQEETTFSFRVLTVYEWNHFSLLIFCPVMQEHTCT